MGGRGVESSWMRERDFGSGLQTAERFAWIWQLGSGTDL